ncbi:MAG: hypothetical protein ACYC7I_11170 [Gammaproteobacteria bacterium]
MTQATSNAKFIFMRKLSGVLIGLYGLALVILFFSVLFWNNKGAGSVFEKSAEDWVLVMWLAISALIVLRGAVSCLFKLHSTCIPLLFVTLVTLINAVLLVARSSGEAVTYLGLPHLVAGVGIVLGLSADCFGRGPIERPPL